MIEAIIFDLYGTLVHRSRETRFYYRLFTELSLDYKEVLAAKHICLTEHLPDITSLVKRLCPHKSIDTASYDAELREEIESCILYPETLEVLDALKQRGVRMGLASNLATPYKEPFYSLGLAEFIPAPTFSCDEGVVKPEEKIYRIALSSVKVQPQNALMVGDKFNNDVQGPLSVGMNAVLLDREGSSSYSHRIKTLRGLLALAI